MDSQIFSAVKVSLHEMGTQYKACPCQTNPHAPLFDLLLEGIQHSDRADVHHHAMHIF